MYEHKRFFSLQKTSNESLVDVLKENLKNYCFEKNGDIITFKYCNHSFGLYYNSFLLEGEIKLLNSGKIMCKCELPKSVKDGFYGLNFVLFLILLLEIIKTPEVIGTLLVILILGFIGINVFAYIGLFISSAIFYNQIKKII